MRKLAILLLIALVLSAGCLPAAPSRLVVSLATPVEGSTVTSLTPVLSWNGSGGATSYRLQVAADSNFQEYN